MRQVNQVSIASYNALSPIRRQTIVETNAELLSSVHLGTNVIEILNQNTNKIIKKNIWNYRQRNGGHFV